jgi:hypothetical protein
MQDARLSGIPAHILKQEEDYQRWLKDHNAKSAQSARERPLIDFRVRCSFRNPSIHLTLFIDL